MHSSRQMMPTNIYIDAIKNKFFVGGGKTVRGLMVFEGEKGMEAANLEKIKRLKQLFHQLIFPQQTRLSWGRKDE